MRPRPIYRSRAYSLVQQSSHLGLQTLSRATKKIEPFWTAARPTNMTHHTAYRPAKPRVRLLTAEDRRLRAALKPRAIIPGQVFTDWAAI